LSPTRGAIAIIQLAALAVLVAVLLVAAGIRFHRGDSASGEALAPPPQKGTAG
jgi:hypothetical protein